MTNKLFKYGFSLGFVCFVVSLSTLYAQTTGVLVGTVVDPSGAVVPGASLKLQSVDTNAVRTITSDSSGNYVFDLLLPQTYELTAEKAGFTEVVINGLKITVDSPLRQNISFKLEKAAQQVVTVTANATTVNTETPTLGDVIGSAEITNLPLNGRDFLQLATLTAGAYAPSPSSEAQGESGGRQATLTVSVSGSRESSAEFLFDGIESKHDYFGAVGFEPPPDSIMEFKIEQGYFSPQFGLPGVVNVVTKSGTNSFHGAAYEFLRNDILDAKNFFDLPTTPKPPYRQNQFGGDIGGPILKNKLFFFGYYDALRVRQASTAFYVVPTPAELQGNFSGEAPIIDPSTGFPFPNNQIPSADFAPFSTKFNAYMPTSTAPNNPSYGGANFFGSNDYILNNTQYSVKIDYVLSDKDSFFGRYTFLNSDLTDTSILPGNGDVFPLDTRTAVLSWTHIFGPQMLNDFRAGLDRTSLDDGSAQNAGGPNYPMLLGLQNLNQIPICNALPSVTLQTYTTFGFSFGYCTVTRNTNKIFLDNLSLTRGRNDITIGGQVTRQNLSDIIATAQTGTFNFTGQYTGNAIADYLIGSPYSVSGGQPLSPYQLRAWDPEVYVNDNMHALHNLTLNFGMRWQYNGPYTETQNHYGYFNFQTGQVMYAGVDGTRRSPMLSHWLNFAPRVGFAYGPDPNTSIRGSYGIFYDRIPGNQLVWGGVLPLYQGSYAATGGSTSSGIDISTLFPIISGTPQGGPGTGIATFVDRPTAYVQQWSLSFQHTFPWDIFAQIAYVGNRGEHESTRADTNQLASPPPSGTTDIQPLRPYPHFSYILTDRGIGDSTYEGLQGTLRKTLSNGLSFLSAYTFASAIQAVGEWGDFMYRWNVVQRGFSVDDPRQRWVTSLIYALPFGQGARGFRRQVIGGWTVNGILTLQTGYPFSISVPIDTSNTGLIFPHPQANRVCNPELPGGQRNRFRWFDTSCFVVPPTGTYGDAGINNVYGPGTRNLDFAAIKSFRLRDNYSLEFRSEFFNGLNFVNFGNPGQTVGTPGYGAITGASAGREIQFALKFIM